MQSSIDQTLRKAKRCFNNGEIRIAAEHYQSVLSRYPQNPRAIAGLKALRQSEAIPSTAAVEISLDQVNSLLALYNEAKFEQALELGESLARQFPTTPLLPNLLGAVNRGMGRIEQAVVSFTKALQINPKYAEAHYNLGNALRELGRLDQAIDCYHKALAVNPDYAMAYNNLGIALQELNRVDEAIINLRKTITLQPSYAEAHHNLGRALVESGKLDEAIACYHNALDIKPGYVEVYNSLGNALKRQGKSQEAIASFQKALGLKPDLVEAHHNLGSVFQGLGKLDEAIACFHRALATNPNLGETHRHLAFSKKFVEYDADVKSMEEAYASLGVSEEQRMNLAFGLGKAFEDLHQYQKAFDFYLVGNSIKRSTYKYSIESVVGSMARLKQIFTTEFFGRHQAVGTSDPSPIFILGMPRSGTTLVEQILASHPSVYGGGEMTHLKQIVTSHFAEPDDARFAESLEQANECDFASAGSEYLDAIRVRAPATPFITDKLPLNFRLIGMIKLLLPNARIIHCCRDSRDTCVSIFKNYFAFEGNHYAYHLGELGQYHNHYQNLMAHWHRVLPGFIYDVHYEDLVADQETQTRSLLQYCGLDWDDACLEFYNTERLVETASLAQVRRPIYKESVQSWTRFGDGLAPLLDSLHL